MGVSDQHDFLTTRQVANLLRISTRTVQKMVQRGDLRAIRVGRLLRFDARAVRGFISSNSTAARTGTDAGEAADTQHVGVP